MQKAKSFEISKHLVWQAYLKVKENNGSGGIDGIELEDYEKDVKNNLYKLWNRMSSGTYFPKPVRLVEIPKDSGGTRTLGIATIEDRVAQQVVVMMLEPLMEPHFHNDSYGYRPGRSAHQALGEARIRCWRYDWVLDLDISKYFDSINHELLTKAVERHTDCKWVLLYISRWLVVPYQLKDGTLEQRNKGIAQGSNIGPLLSNLFLHYVFDKWMQKQHADIPFERYVDDAICHCITEQQAVDLRKAIKERFAECGLELNEAKTRIVYCKDDDRRGNYPVTKFDFLGYTFRARRSKNKNGKFFINFTPAISNKAKTKITRTMRKWQLRSKADKTIEDIARMFNRIIQGWINYYGKYYKSAMYPLFQHFNRKLGFWVRMKFKRYKNHNHRAVQWLGRVAKQQPNLFAHWKMGVRPPIVKVVVKPAIETE
jgi:RNA-directed DNA polymerase